MIKLSSVINDKNNPLFVIFINNVHKTCNSISHKRIINHKILNDIELVKIRHLFNNKSLRESRKNKEHENLILKVSIEHLQRVRHAKGGRLLLRTPGPVPLWDLHVFLS